MKIKHKQGETVHVAAFVPQDVAKAAKIQAITEGLTLQDWISRAINRQLAESGKIPEGTAWGDRSPAEAWAGTGAALGAGTGAAKRRGKTA
jgi:hypothetical protein